MQGPVVVHDEGVPEAGLHMPWVLHVTAAEAAALWALLSEEGGAGVPARERRERALAALFGEALAAFVVRSRVRLVVRRDVSVIPNPAQGVRRLAPEWWN
jgi:hypothetical protein